MKTTGDIRKYAAERDIAGQKAPGMEAKSKELQGENFSGLWSRMAW